MFSKFLETHSFLAIFKVDWFISVLLFLRKWAEVLGNSDLLHIVISSPGEKYLLQRSPTETEPSYYNQERRFIPSQKFISTYYVRWLFLASAAERYWTFFLLHTPSQRYRNVNYSRIQGKKPLQVAAFVASFDEKGVRLHFHVPFYALPAEPCFQNSRWIAKFSQTSHIARTSLPGLVEFRNLLSS